MFGDALARQIETVRELHDRVLLPVTEARHELEAGPVAKSCKHGSRTKSAPNVRHGR